MKPKIKNLEDIRREKQKLQREIGIQEYALEFNFIQIRKKLSFVSLSVYVLDMAREKLKAKVPSFLYSILNGLLSRLFKRK